MITCAGQILEGDSILTLTITFYRVMQVPTGALLHHLLSSLSWSQDEAEVVDAAVILEDVTHLEGDVDPMVADKWL